MAAGSRERVTASRPDLRHPSSSVSSLLLPIRRTSHLCLETSRSQEAPSGSPSAASSLPSRERTQSPARRRDRRRRSRLTAVGALAPAAGSVPASRVLPHVCECAGVCVCTHTRMCAIARERTACERLQARTRGGERGERAPMSTHTWECACARAHTRECAWDCAWMSVHERECVGMSVCGRTLKSSTAPSCPALGHRVNPGMFAG